jgi:hypothetical protein
VVADELVPAEAGEPGSGREQGVRRGKILVQVGVERRVVDEGLGDGRVWDGMRKVFSRGAYSRNRVVSSGRRRPNISPLRSSCSQALDMP